MALHKGGEIMNYNSSIRSNYFKITDRDAFKKLCDKLSGEDSVEVSLNEQNMHAFHAMECSRGMTTRTMTT